jgi:ATP-binding cassette subfamily B protein
MPEGGAREVIFQVSTERLLQYQNMLSEETPSGSAQLPSLSVQWVRVPGRVIARRFPFVAEASPVAAGVACLTMLDGFCQRESRWQERLEQLLWERRTDNLLSLSRTIEECGYFTRLITPRLDQLRHVGLPAIIEDDDGTPAVLFGVDAGDAILAHPSRGIRHVALADFQAHWNGQLLVVMPAAREERLAPVRSHASQVAAMAFIALLIDVFGVGLPLAGKAVVDRVLVDGDLSMLRLLLVGVLVLVGFQLLATVLRDYLLAHTTRRVTLSLQRRFLDHILRLRQSVASTQHVGDLAVRFRENEALAERAFRTGLALVADTAAVLLYLIVLWWLSHALAVIALVFVAAYAAVMAASSPFVRRIGQRRGETRQAAQSHLIEAVSGMQTIKALAAEPLFFARGRKLMLRWKADEFSATRLTVSVELVGAVLHLAAMAAIVGVGARLAVAGTATTGDMVAALGLVGAMIVPLNGLIESRDGLRGIRSTSANLAGIYRLETEVSPSATVPPVIQGHVVFKDVSFRYPGAAEDVLSEINLEILPGRNVAVVGRSGSGKTTLLNLLTGLYEPTRGNIYIDHVDIGNIPKSALRRQIGVVEQQPFLFEGTIRDNIGKADPSLPLERIAAVAALAGAHEFIDALSSGYDTPVGERGTMLSGGEKQRLMIARALVGAPRILVLDEATSALDSGTESVIQRNLRQATEGRTTFVIAHRLSTVRDADLIVVLDQGRIVETGTHPDLMARRGLYFYLNTRTV